MCNAVSGITKSDGTILMPDPQAWNHSHAAIAALHKLPDGLMGDTAARWELTPENGDYRSDPAAWPFSLDEQRAPRWWSEDAPALEDKARQAVIRWLGQCPDNIKPGFKAQGGDRSTLTGGDGSTLTGGYRSTLTGGDGSTLTGGDGSTLTGGDGSTLTGGYGSTLTGGDGSTLTGGYRSTLSWRVWDSTHRRYRTVYTGENGIKAGGKYRLDGDKVVEVVEAAKV